MKLSDKMKHLSRSPIDPIIMVEYLETPPNGEIILSLDSGLNPVGENCATYDIDFIIAYLGESIVDENGELVPSAPIQVDDWHAMLDTLWEHF